MATTLATRSETSESARRAAPGPGGQVERRVVEMVRSMVTCALADLDPSPAGSETLGVHRYRALLAALTYSYAMGVFGSKDVELLIEAHAPLRELLGTNLPTANELRRFRRGNRPVLLHCLSTTLRRLRDLESSATPPGRCIVPQPAWCESGDVSEMELRRLSQVESLTRIQRAVREDSGLSDE